MATTSWTDCMSGCKYSLYSMFNPPFVINTFDLIAKIIAKKTPRSAQNATYYHLCQIFVDHLAIIVRVMSSSPGRINLFLKNIFKSKSILKTLQNSQGMYEMNFSFVLLIKQKLFGHIISPERIVKIYPRED